MRYEWDENKNRINEAKHGIAFEAMVGFEWDTAVTGIDAEKTMVSCARPHLVSYKPLLIGVCGAG